MRFERFNSHSDRLFKLIRVDSIETHHWKQPFFNRRCESARVSEWWRKRTPAHAAYGSVWKGPFFFWLFEMARRRDATLKTNPSPPRQNQQENVGQAEWSPLCRRAVCELHYGRRIFLLQGFPFQAFNFVSNPRTCPTISRLVSEVIFCPWLGGKSSCQIPASVAVIALTASRCALKC